MQMCYYPDGDGHWLNEFLQVYISAKERLDMLRKHSLFDEAAQVESRCETNGPHDVMQAKESEKEKRTAERWRPSNAG